MTVGTKRYKVLFRVIPGLTAKLFVMNLKALHAAADLTSPAISTQHLPSQLFVQLGIETQARVLSWNPVQDAFSICATNACLCSPGRNLKNLEIDCNSNSGLPLSRFAPAKKSAQIISRQ